MTCCHLTLTSHERIYHHFPMLLFFLSAYSNSSHLTSNIIQDSISLSAINLPFEESTPSDIEGTNSFINSDSTNYDMIIRILSLVVAIIAVVIALVGLYNFFRIEKLKQDFDTLRNTDIKNLQNTLDCFKDSIGKEQKSTFRLCDILQKQNESLYSIFKALEEGKSPHVLRKIITLNYHINRLYISCIPYENKEQSCIDLFDTFSYLKQYGKKEDIPHLVFLSQNHPNIKDREQANAVIGFIQARQEQ